MIARARVYLSFSLLLLTSLIFLTGCSAFDFRTLHTLRNLAGRDAIDCGVAFYPASTPRVNACAIGASVEGVPFFFRYQIKHNPAINHGFARAPNGNLLEVTVEDQEDSQQQDSSPAIFPCADNTLVPDATATGLKLLTCNR